MQIYRDDVLYSFGDGPLDDVTRSMPSLGLPDGGERCFRRKSLLSTSHAHG
jgi:hypothetical protein